MRHAESAQNSYSTDGSFCGMLLWGYDMDESANAADGNDFDPRQTSGDRGAAGDGVAEQSKIRSISSGHESGSVVANGDGADSVETAADRLCQKWRTADIWHRSDD